MPSQRHPRWKTKTETGGETDAAQVRIPYSSGSARSFVRLSSNMQWRWHCLLVWPTRSDVAAFGSGASRFARHCAQAERLRQGHVHAVKQEQEPLLLLRATMQRQQQQEEQV